ncbi:MAG: hypothetical protein M3N98_01595 [Actinomycetota bacterium]|nr:hypothetical protein [Actinomycetota bacterium]
MFFLLPKVILVLFACFAAVSAWRAYRQRRSPGSPAVQARAAAAADSTRLGWMQNLRILVRVLRRQARKPR